MSLVKTEDQIENITYSCNILRKLLKDLNSLIRPGINLLEIDSFVEHYIRDHKGIPSFKNFHGFPNSACISINEDAIHGIPTNSTLKDGDIVGVDVGMIYNGGYGDTAYTYTVGEVSSKVKDLLDVCKESLNKGIEKAIVGNRVGDVSSSIEKFIKPKGYGIVKEYCGHGVGCNVWEEPAIPNFGSSGHGMKFKKNMIVAIEPIITLGSSEVYTKNDKWTVSTVDKSYSAHYEHTVLIGEQPKILT